MQKTLFKVYTYKKIIQKNKSTKGSSSEPWAIKKKNCFL